jgi:hypothetical protein
LENILRHTTLWKVKVLKFNNVKIANLLNILTQINFPELKELRIIVSTRIGARMDLSHTRNLKTPKLERLYFCEPLVQNIQQFWPEMEANLPKLKQYHCRILFVYHRF